MTDLTLKQRARELLAAESELGAWRAIPERILPVERGHHGLDLARGQAARVEAADHSAHAGAGDCIYGDMQLIEHFQHANVRCATRATA